jgi:hypothetical protein
MDFALLVSDARAGTLALRTSRNGPRGNFRAPAPGGRGSDDRKTSGGVAACGCTTREEAIMATRNRRLAFAAISALAAVALIVGMI